MREVHNECLAPEDTWVEELVLTHHGVQYFLRYCNPLAAFLGILRNPLFQGRFDFGTDAELNSAKKRIYHQVNRCDYARNLAKSLPDLCAGENILLWGFYSDKTHLDFQGKRVRYPVYVFILNLEAAASYNIQAIICVAYLPVVQASETERKLETHRALKSVLLNDCLRRVFRLVLQVQHHGWDVRMPDDSVQTFHLRLAAVPCDMAESWDLLAIMHRRGHMCYVAKSQMSHIPEDGVCPCQLRSVRDADDAQGDAALLLEKGIRSFNDYGRPFVFDLLSAGDKPGMDIFVVMSALERLHVCGGFYKKTIECALQFAGSTADVLHQRMAQMTHFPYFKIHAKGFQRANLDTKERLHMLTVLPFLLDGIKKQAFLFSQAVLQLLEYVRSLRRTSNTAGMKPIPCLS